MSALYKGQYQGVTGFGGGVYYIGRGRILGMDVTGASYDGSYSQQGNRMQGTATLSSAGGTLVTGQPVPPGTKVTITFDWPTNFADGQYRAVHVGGQPVQVAFTKIGDVP